MTREQAKEILNGMSLDECIKMWNDGVNAHDEKISEIHEMEDTHWWDYIAERSGTYYLMWYLLHNSGDTFDRYDEYFLYNENNDTFYSFTTKDELLEYIEEFFIEEITNRN